MFSELWYSLCSSYHGYQKELVVSSHYLKNRPLGPTSGDSSPCVETPKLCILSLQLSLGMLPKARCHHNGTFSPCAPATLQRQVSPASLKPGVTVMSDPLETRKSHKLQAHQANGTTSPWYQQSGHPRAYFCTEAGIIFLNTRTAPEAET